MMIPATTRAPMMAKMLRTQCDPLPFGEGRPAGCCLLPGPGPGPDCAPGIGCVCGAHAAPSHQRRTCWPPGSGYHPGGG